MLSVLIVSPHPSVPGGVSVFIENMKRKAVRSEIASFYVGSKGKGSESFLSIATRLCVAPFKLASRVKQKHFDVAHINPSFDLKSLVRDGLLILALRTVGFRPIFIYFHGWDFDVQRRILNNTLLRKMLVWALSQASLITVLGDDFRDGLIAIGVDPARVCVTRTMFEGEGLKEKGTKSPQLRRFILFMSRFDREKGGHELIDAFAKIAPHYPDLDLVMAGDGEEALFLETQAGKLGLDKRIRFTGYIGGEEKKQLLRECTLFALPTYYRSEGMPVAVLEGMGAGKPLLVGSAGVMRSFVSDPENGVVLNQITPDTIAIGLKRLLDDPVFAEKTGRHNLETAWAKFEAQVVAADIENFYQRVAQC